MEVGSGQVGNDWRRNAREMPALRVDARLVTTRRPRRRRLGATILKDVTEGMGSLSILTDPTGAIIGLWQTRM